MMVGGEGGGGVPLGTPVSSLPSSVNGLQIIIIIMIMSVFLQHLKRAQLR